MILNTFVLNSLLEIKPNSREVKVEKKVGHTVKVIFGLNFNEYMIKGIEKNKKLK